MSEDLDSLSVDDFIRKLCETKTVYRFRGDSLGSYRTMDILYCPRIREHLFSQYSGYLEEILNEHYGKMVLDEVADEERLRCLCETQTVVLMKDSPDGEYSYLETPFSPEFKKRLVEAHGDNIIEFVNERFVVKKDGNDGNHTTHAERRG